MTVPMLHFWADISVDPYPRHLPDRDGFGVEVRMRYLLADPLPVDRLVVRLVSATTASREISLESARHSTIEMRKGVNRAIATTTVTVPGSYIVEQLTVHAGKLRFVHEFMAASAGTVSPGRLALLPAVSNSAVTAATAAAAALAARKTKLRFFPAPRALTGRLEMPKDIFLDRMRSVEIVVSAGQNHVVAGELRIRSATAGLRLITASIEMIEGADAVAAADEPAAQTGGKPGTLALRDLRPRQRIRLRLPYSSDNELAELMVRLEVDYTTSGCAGVMFQYVDTLKVMVALPLAVNVQDIFKQNTLYSKFQVSCAVAEVPLRLFTATLAGSRSFEARGGKGASGNMTVFAKQPASFVYQITRRKKAGDSRGAKQDDGDDDDDDDDGDDDDDDDDGDDEGRLPESLRLVIEYTNMDEGPTPPGPFWFLEADGTARAAAHGGELL